MRTDVFPVGLKLEGRLCLVVGQGPETEARARALLDAGARVRVVSVAPPPGVTALAAAGSVALEARSFLDEDLEGVWLAVQTDLDGPLAARVSRAAEARAVFFCAVDQPEHSSYSHAALARSGPVTVAISTNGRAPALARRLREELERLFASAGLGAFAEHLFALRERTPPAERRGVLGAAVREVRFTGELELGRRSEGDD